MLFDENLGLNGVAFRFVHGVAVAVERPSGGSRASIRRSALQRDRDQQRALEPSTVLIASFQIHVGGPGQIVLGRQDSKMTGTGIEPDVEDVAFLAIRTSTTLGASI